MLTMCLPAVFTNSPCLFSVENCIKMCGLEAYADAVVGSLSIEHHKRTTIAVELAAKVGTLFLSVLSMDLTSFYY